MAVKEFLFVSWITHSGVLEYGKAVYGIDLTNRKTIPPTRKKWFL